MSSGDYLVGVVFFAAVWGSAAAVASLVLRRRTSRLRGAYAVLAWALLFLGALLSFHLVPGMLGILSRGTVLAAAFVGVVAALRIRPAEAGGEGEGVGPYPEPSWPEGKASRWLAWGAVAVVAIDVLGTFEQLATQAPSHVDALTFGLPGVAHWLREGSIWDTGSFLRLFQVRTYPNSGDLLTLASILPWRNDAFVRFPEPALVAMTGVGVYAIGRELRAPFGSAALLAALLLSIKTLALPALVDLKPDVFMYATFAAGCAFLLRHTRTRTRGDLLLAGLGLGLAFGSRWYGISSVIVVLAVWAGGLLLEKRALRVLVRDAALLGGTVLAVGGVWLVRNLALTGNPVYPIKVAPLGVTIFDAPRDIITEKLGFSIADRLDQPSVWRHYILPDYSHVIGFPGLVLLAGVVFVLAIAVIRRRSAESLGRPAAVAVAAVLLACAYAITPAGSQGFAAAPLRGFVGANSRWLVPAMLLAAPAAAWSLGRLGRARVGAQLVVAVAVLAGVRQTFSVSPARLVLTALVLGAAAAGAWLLLRWRPWSADGSRRALVAALAAIGVLGVVGAGQAQQHRYNDRRFVGRSEVVDWMLVHAPGGHNVGIAGGWSGGAFVPTYAMFGPRLRNDVTYLGPVRRGQVGQYRSSRSFRGAIQRDHVDLVVVGRVGTPNLDHPAPLPIARNPRFARWAEADGFRQVAQDGNFVLLARDTLSARG